MHRTSSLPQYKEIELTPDEIAEALRKGRKEKFYQMRAENHWKKTDEPDQAPKMDSINYFKWVIRKAKEQFEQQKNEREFIIEEGRYDVYNELVKYFTGEDCKYQKHKGILLQGNIGCGKSMFLKLCSNNPLKSFHVFDCIKLAAQYAESEESLISRFRNALGPKAFDPWKHQYCGAMFDDLGWEETVKHYGNEVNVMERVINGIYSASLPFNSYHATTNLTEDELETKYGSRIISRLHEMFNFIILPGKDLRK